MAGTTYKTYGTAYYSSLSQKSPTLHRQFAARAPLVPRLCLTAIKLAAKALWERDFLYHSAGRVAPKNQKNRARARARARARKEGTGTGSAYLNGSEALPGNASSRALPRGSQDASKEKAVKT
jgi:hypothetical protein